eukprot:3573786-Prymnesium_polylepis.1
MAINRNGLHTADFTMWVPRVGTCTVVERSAAASCKLQVGMTPRSGTGGTWVRIPVGPAERPPSGGLSPASASDAPGGD